MSDAQLDEAARLFAILAEPSRLRLLRTLMNQSMTVTELIETTGMKQGNISKHLAVLLDSRFVAKAKEGNFARYAIADLKLFELCELVCGRIKQDAKHHLEKLVGKNS